MRRCSGEREFCRVNVVRDDRKSAIERRLFYSKSFIKIYSSPSVRKAIPIRMVMDCECSEIFHFNSCICIAFSNFEEVSVTRRVQRVSCLVFRPINMPKPESPSLEMSRKHVVELAGRFNSMDIFFRLEKPSSVSTWCTCVCVCVAPSVQSDDQKTMSTKNRCSYKREKIRRCRGLSMETGSETTE